MRRLYPQAGRAHLVGITGPPGVRQVDARRGPDRRRSGRRGGSVAVVAVDPSSPITGGALLGDRVRMQAYAGDDDVFIRSMASRGHAGGLASTSTARRGGARRGRLRPGPDRDCRNRPERGRGRGRGRHDRRARGARDGRRGPGDQGRPSRGRRPRRRQQGRQAGRPANGGPASGDARGRRAASECCLRRTGIGLDRSVPRS